MGLVVRQNIVLDAAKIVHPQSVLHRAEAILWYDQALSQVYG